MKKSARHHSCYRGGRVQILLPDNVLLEGRFLEERSTFIIITVNNEKVKINRKNMLSFRFLKCEHREEGKYICQQICKENSK